MTKVKLAETEKGQNHCSDQVKFLQSNKILFFVYFLWYGLLNICWAQFQKEDMNI